MRTPPQNDPRNDIAPGRFEHLDAYTSAPTQRLRVPLVSPGTPKQASRVKRGLLAAILALLAFALLFETLITFTPLGGRGSSGFTYRAGYSIQQGWLCYGWSDGALHCTSHWGYVGGVATSANTAWVPNYSGRPTTSSPASGISPTPSNLSQWAYTGYPAFPEPWHINVYPWGQCTDFAQHMAPGLWGLGNAKDWYWNARARGIATGFSPRVGSTVVFQPFVQGAGSLGHVAHVAKVYSNGWFLVSEVNFYWNGGGWARVDYRYAHVGSGVSFIYG